MRNQNTEGDELVNMITEDIKRGDKVIFTERGGVLSTDKGNVFTFYGWWTTHWGSNRFWQCQELIDEGNIEHNFSAYECEIFDPEKHAYLNPKFMNHKELEKNRREFIEKYGA